MSAELRNRKRLERLRQQADALLALTQAINRNVEDAELFGSYREVLESMGVGKLALFCLGENVGLRAGTAWCLGATPKRCPGCPMPSQL